MLRAGGVGFWLSGLGLAAQVRHAPRRRAEGCRPGIQLRQPLVARCAGACAAGALGHRQTRLQACNRRVSTRVAHAALHARTAFQNDAVVVVRGGRTASQRRRRAVVERVWSARSERMECRRALGTHRRSITSTLEAIARDCRGHVWCGNLEKWKTTSQHARPKTAAGQRGKSALVSATTNKMPPAQFFVSSSVVAAGILTSPQALYFSVAVLRRQA